MKVKQRMQKPHIMKFVEITALVLAILIVEIVVGIALFRRAKEIAYNGQMDDYQRSISRFAEHLDGAIERERTETPDFSATLSGTELAFDGVTRLYAADANIAANLKSRSVNLYRLSEICANSTADARIREDQTVYVIYSTAGEGGTFRLGFCALDRLLVDIPADGFDGIVVFSGSGRSEYVAGTGEDEADAPAQLKTRSALEELQKYRLSLTAGNFRSTTTVKAGGTVWALSIAPMAIDGDYTVGGYGDFNAGQRAIDSLGIQIVLSLVGIGAFTALVVYFCAYAFANREKELYAFTVDSEGTVLHRNKRFETEFPAVHVIAERLNRFDENRVYAIRLEQGEEKRLISCVVKKQFDGTVDVLGRELTVPAGDDIEMERKDNLAAMYHAMTTENKKVLLGEIYFNNLLEIKDVFGREFAETVRNLLIDRARKQFESVFVFDYYTLGVLQPEGNRLDIMLRDMERVVSDLNRVAKSGDNNVLVNVKCGFAISDSTVKELSYEEIMEASDAALKRACEPQSDTLNRVDFYVYQESQRKLYAKYLFKIDIPQMLKDGDFYLEYQPQYGLAEDRIVGFEALFRVQKRVQINASVMDIINYAERSGNMVLLGNFILNEGMKFAKSIEGMGASVSLNVSPVQMMQTGFVDNFLKIYNSYDLKPGSISVEITESYLVSDIAATLKKLEVLRANGIDIHLDDFGTGYSSFGYLAKLPISTIKVDQSFVRDIATNRVNRLIAKTIIDICKSLNLKSICEGVENDEQLQLLRAEGCDTIQGYVISRSVRDDVARDMIEHYRYQPPVADAPAEEKPDKKK